MEQKDIGSDCSTKTTAGRQAGTRQQANVGGSKMVVSRTHTVVTLTEQQQKQ